MGEVGLLRPWASEQLWLCLTAHDSASEPPTLGTDPSRAPQKMSTPVTLGESNEELGTGQD